MLLGLHQCCPSEDMPNARQHISRILCPTFHNVLCWVAPEGLGEKVGRGTEAIVHRLLLALSRSWSYATGGGSSVKDAYFVVVVEVHACSSCERDLLPLLSPPAALPHRLIPWARPGLDVSTTMLHRPCRRNPRSAVERPENCSFRFAAANQLP